MLVCGKLCTTTSKKGPSHGAPLYNIFRNKIARAIFDISVSNVLYNVERVQSDSTPTAVLGPEEYELAYVLQ